MSEPCLGIRWFALRDARCLRGGGPARSAPPSPSVIAINDGTARYYGSSYPNHFLAYHICVPAFPFDRGGIRRSILLPEISIRMGWGPYWAAHCDLLYSSDILPLPGSGGRRFLTSATQISRSCRSARSRTVSLDAPASRNTPRVQRPGICINVPRPFGSATHTTPSPHFVMLGLPNNLFLLTTSGVLARGV